MLLDVHYSQNAERWRWTHFFYLKNAITPASALLYARAGYENVERREYHLFSLYRGDQSCSWSKKRANKNIFLVLCTDSLTLGFYSVDNDAASSITAPCL